ncbi:MAG: efflux RND transporter permease subunit [Prevotellaceae bacterium]|jgi:multidrug efflux pump|nr:efflux RND transporter permease subunit [Prevotellaceae bacterium]
MSLSSTSIDRPVLSTVFMIVILLFGMIGLTFLGVREYPSVDPPIISVSTSYIGANADIIEKQITEPLEQSINGIEGIRSLTSTSSTGSSRITVEFELSRDMESAANDVRDKVSKSQRLLPQDCDPPTVSKADADSDPIMMIGIKSDRRSLLELSELADLTYKEQLQTISGISAITIWGEKRYAMRLWMNPSKLAGYGLTPLDVRNALLRENVELPSGKLEGENVELTIRAQGLMTTPNDFNRLIISQQDNKIIRFSDVGYAELGAEDIRSIMKLDGTPGVGVNIIPQPGSNHVEIADEIYKRMALIAKDLPEDVRVDLVYDNTKFIRASIGEVRETIVVAFVLVVLIIFLFLRDWRTTLIPTVVIPVSLVGAFFVMYLAGFSINTLSLLAIVLAIGLVVDDAIVMMENIYVKIEAGMSPLEAGKKGSDEIFFAVVSTTITLVAVFLPIVFLQGTTGRLFREFSIVISGSVLISAFVALTFTPMLSTKILKHRKRQPWLYRVTDPFFVGLNSVYSRSLNAFMRHRWLALAITAITLVGMVFLWMNIPSEMAPLEDRSALIIRGSGTEGSTFDFMNRYMDQVYDEALESAPETQASLMRAWIGGGFIRLILVPQKERERSQQQLYEALSPQLQQYTAARSFIMQQSTFGGRRSGMPVQYVLQATSLDKLKEFTPRFMAKVYESPVFQMADIDLKFTKPEVRMEINRDKANLMGVSTQNIGQTLQLGLSGQRFGYFFINSKQYQVIGQMEQQYSSKMLDLKSIYVKNDASQMVQLDNLVTLREESSPPNLYRYNRFVSATVSAGLAKGKTIGDGLDEMDRIAKETLDETFRTALAGESKEFRDSSSSLMFAFLLAIVLIYLVLAAQFESFRDPLIIMFTVPLALFGALLFLWWAGKTMNIFSQIGVIMLIGLVSKNGILIVEFANQRRENGLSIGSAIIESATARFRPILMTSLSTLLGVLPLAFATGEGANSRIMMGTAVAGGLLISTFMTLYVVPATYTYLTSKKDRAKLANNDDNLKPEI